jgi:hypothetical protein
MEGSGPREHQTDCGNEKDQPPNRECHRRDKSQVNEREQGFRLSKASASRKAICTKPAPRVGTNVVDFLAGQLHVAHRIHDDSIEPVRNKPQGLNPLKAIALPKPHRV